MTTEKNKQNPLFGMAWTSGKTFDNHAAAAQEKTRIESESQDVSVKIRRTPENRFLIKTRINTLPDENKKKTKSEKSVPKNRSQRKKAKAEKNKARQEKAKK